MARALDDDEILFPRRAVEGILQPFDEEIVVGVLDVAPGEIRLDRDGTHVLQGHLHVEGILHEHGVLVDLLALDLDEALADGLDVADAPEPLLERGEQPQRGRRLAVVLAGGGDEQARGGGIHRSGMTAPDGTGGSVAGSGAIGGAGGSGGGRRHGRDQRTAGCWRS